MVEMGWWFCEICCQVQKIRNHNWEGGGGVFSVGHLVAVGGEFHQF